ncbi:sugar phosphate isomerase/epimerase family protein [Algoriphagus sp. NG3]|uniref:sugar phosphate isomerase/epimerase family protein n=1 Tax=unclassified Algoriphagus TaxID=2641541 RepID=UPI002A826F70|nr:sugar phosphate isomerase/epimerase family protein [Algoriphagus sp. NG3]WPR73400.1 sugar phosphate isomerase/epimerase family protein [Algoriphagus sp. NG3]
MQFGVSTFLWVSPFDTHSFDLVHKVNEMGFDIIEVPVEDKELVDWDALKKLTDELGLKVSISGAFGADRDISSGDPAIRANGLQYIEDSIKIAAKMGSPLFGGPLYSAVGKLRSISAEQKKLEFDWCVSNLKKACKTAEEYGITLGLEPLNRFESDMVNTVDQALDIVKAVDSPYLKIQLDTFHNNIEEKNIAASIRKVGKELLCHVQGNESDRGTPGTGNLAWDEIKEALVEIGYEGAIVIETFGAVSKEMAKATCIWRPLANSADELASEGLAFYKSHFGS